MAERLSKIVMTFFAIVIGIYPVIYFGQGRNFGLPASKSDELLASPIWYSAFYLHITFGGLALLSGWIQFFPKYRIQYPSVHRNFGKAYLASVLISSMAGIVLGFSANGGVVSSIGFICLGVFWFTTTLLAYFRIREGKTNQHQRLMIYSYAACFAAVTLRLWLPLLMMFLDYLSAYRIVAWLCWVPNLLVAYFIINRRLSN